MKNRSSAHNGLEGDRHESSYYESQVTREGDSSERDVTCTTGNVIKLNSLPSYTRTCSLSLINRNAARGQCRNSQMFLCSEPAGPCNSGYNRPQRKVYVGVDVATLLSGAPPLRHSVKADPPIGEKLNRYWSISRGKGRM